MKKAQPNQNFAPVLLSEETEWVSPAKLAKDVDMTAQTICNWARRGFLNYFQPPGGKISIGRKSWENFIKAFTRQARFGKIA